MTRRLRLTLRCSLSALIVSLFALVASPSAAAAPPRDPVVVVAGTFGPAFFYEPLAARVRAGGAQAFVFELPALGTGDIANSARALDTFVDGVLARTGASRVDLVGHSQGGLVGRQFIRFEGGSAVVDSLVSLGAPHYGTAVANIADFFGLGTCLGVVACEQMALGSDFLARLNAGDDTVGNVRYTNLFTALDELVRPVQNAALADGATNVLIQSQCPARVVAHVGLALDGTAYDGVRDALLGEPVRLNCLAV
ncbi:alpha/beta fold hydrolase [Actinophytocola xanthii]|uniref:Lipase n=1 Tax=Actinophytocola xanthii TaxID=1912961 RepID=A0A1Q8CS25_9PSEU|nr:alpha/beta fold hydrolase [Actinophytocola xanthii]OLF17169.1 lipase [Actinophytocola xanthii]